MNALSIRQLKIQLALFALACTPIIAFNVSSVIGCSRFSGSSVRAMEDCSVETSCASGAMSGAGDYDQIERYRYQESVNAETRRLAFPERSAVLPMRGAAGPNGTGGLLDSALALARALTS